MQSVPRLLLTTGLLLCTAVSAQAPNEQPPSAAPALTEVARALSGKWQLQVHFEPVGQGGKVVDGPGEEMWSDGPGGINLIEQEHIPAPWGDSYLMGLIWWDGTKKQLAGMECNSYLPFTCDLKGGLNDITITWDGKKFEIDELETHNGKHTVWHEYWTNITDDSFDQMGDVTQPDGKTVRFMTVKAKRVQTLQTIGKN